MKDWVSVADRILQRHAADVIASLPGSEPFSFSAEQYQSELRDILEESYEELLLPGNHVIDLPGRDVLLIGEALFSLSKYTHVLQCARTTAKSGAVTWASVDAHHAAILGARSLFGLLGVIISKANDRYVVLDFRPEFGRPDHVKAFKKQYRGIADPVRILIPEKGKLFEQGDTWALLNRLLRIVTFSTADDQKTASDLIDLKLGSHKPKRNEILYNPAFWLWRQDINFGHLPSAEIAAFVGGNADPLFNDFHVTSLIMKLVVSLANDLANQIGLDVVASVPGLQLGQYQDPILV